MPNGKEEKVLKQFVAKTEIDSDERTVTAIISTIAVDRENEVLLSKGMDYEAYMKNPVVLWAHDYRGEPIGRSLWMKKGRKEIKAKVKFAETEQAEQVYQLFKGGFLKAFSVGFIPHKTHEPTEEEIKKHPEWAEARRIYDEWELLEFSVVPVPANPEALATAVKTKELELSEELIEQLDVDDSVMVYADTATDNDSTDGSTDKTLTIMPTVFQGKVITDISEPEKLIHIPKIQMRKRPKLKKHCIMEQHKDPDEIVRRTFNRTMAKIQGKVYLIE